MVREGTDTKGTLSQDFRTHPDMRFYLVMLLVADAACLRLAPSLRTLAAPAAAVVTSVAPLPAFAEPGDLMSRVFRDPTDGYYFVLGLGLLGFFIKNFASDAIEGAKQQDIANAKAKADGRAAMTAAFMQAAKEKQDTSE